MLPAKPHLHAEGPPTNEVAFRLSQINYLHFDVPKSLSG